MTATAKQGLCCNCNKAISVSHLVNYSAESQTGVCRSCVAKQERAPKTRAKCSHPLHANATPGTWCITCAFPPCSGGCGQPRPQKASNHAKQKSDWYCQNCKGKCVNCGSPLPKNAEAGTWCATCAYPPCSGGCGEPRPQRPANHAKHLQKWFCQHCNAAKQCANCAGPLPSNAEAGTWCATCAYPPCSGGCGEPRPEIRANHAKHLQKWFCQHCNAAKQCANCGGPLPSNAEAGTWCATCAYPPCESCGSQRPRKSGYHVTAMPRWTSEACTVKSCPKCGQVLGPKAQDGALCLACAYPPCESCGRSRPRTHSEYHAQVMPRWTCAACQRNRESGVPKKRLRRG